MAQYVTTPSPGPLRGSVSWCDEELLGQKSSHVVFINSVLLFYKGLLEESPQAINQPKLQVSGRKFEY